MWYRQYSVWAAVFLEFKNAAIREGVTSFTKQFPMARAKL
jgi:hypothetical protein